MMVTHNFIIQQVKFNEAGLVPVIAQQFDTGEVLLLAWMNAESISKTLSTGQVWYFSRSRGKLWRKGETSGQTQLLKQMLLDCDFDTILLKIDQTGVACHTGRKNCFFNLVSDNKIIVNQDIIVPAEELYE